MTESVNEVVRVIIKETGPPQSDTDSVFVTPWQACRSLSWWHSVNTATSIDRYFSESFLTHLTDIPTTKIQKRIL